jgi:hypothetical protein
MLIPVNMFIPATAVLKYTAIIAKQGRLLGTININFPKKLIVSHYAFVFDYLIPCLFLIIDEDTQENYSPFSKLFL